MTAPGYWIAAPDPWGPPDAGLYATASGPPPSRHPNIRPLPDEAFRYCRGLGYPRADACRENCKRLHESVPSSPDSKWVAWRDVGGLVRVEPSFCTDNGPGDALNRNAKARLVPDAEAPEWAHPTELLPPRPILSSTLIAGGPPPPGPSMAEDLARANAAVPPLRLPSGGLEIPGLALEGLDLGGIVNAITGGKLDTAGIVQALVALVLGHDRVRRVLEELAPGTAAAFAPLVANYAALQLQGNQALVSRLEAAIAGPTDGIQGLAANLAVKFGGVLVEIVPDIIRAIVAAAKDLFGPIVGGFRDTVADLAAGVQKVFREQLEQQRGRLPHQLDAVAGRAIGNALLAGTTAQALAAGIEAFYPTKNLGLGQFVGFVADFAGFGQITGPWFGPTVRAAIGNYAEQRAAELFRSNIPGAGEAREQAMQRHIPLADYAAILAKHGLPSWWIQVLLHDVYEDPRPREITELLNGGEAEPAWIAAKLKEVGWDDADVDRGTRALLLKASRDGRQRWISEGVTAYRDGRLSDRELDGVLRGAGLNATHRDAYRRGARLARRGLIMNRVGVQVVNQYVNDLVSRDACGALLVGLGFEVPEVTLRLLEADLRRNVVQVREERVELERELRQLTAAALENLKRQFRAGLVDRATFEAFGMALGFAPAYVANLADLEELRGPPSADEDLPPIGLGAVHEAARTAAAALERDVRGGRVDVEAAVAILTGLGLEHDLAGELLGIAQVLGIPVPGRLGIPVLGDDLGRSAFEQILGEVFQQIRRGAGGSGLLEQLLERLGLPAEHYRTAADVLRTLERLFLQGRSSR